MAQQYPDRAYDSSPDIPDVPEYSDDEREFEHDSPRSPRSPRSPGKQAGSPTSRVVVSLNSIEEARSRFDRYDARCKKAANEKVLNIMHATEPQLKEMDKRRALKAKGAPTGLQNVYGGPADLSFLEKYEQKKKTRDERRTKRDKTMTLGKKFELPSLVTMSTNSIPVPRLPTIHETQSSKAINAENSPEKLHLATDQAQAEDDSTRRHTSRF